MQDYSNTARLQKAKTTTTFWGKPAANVMQNLVLARFLLPPGICFFFASVFAEEFHSLRERTSVYVSAFGGHANLDIRDTNVSQIDVSEVDDMATGWKMYLGVTNPYQLGSFQGVSGLELSYVDLGEAHAIVTPLAGGLPDSFTADFQAVGISGVLGANIGAKAFATGETRVVFRHVR